jgi:uncharacterized protein (DUF1800 family)
MKRLVVLALLALACPMGAGTLTERQRATHALDRLAYGPRPGEIERVLALGVDTWIAQQLEPQKIVDKAVEAHMATLHTLNMDGGEILTRFYRPIVAARREEREVREMRKEAQTVVRELVSQRILRAAESERQLNEVMVDFWMNHFNVFAGKGIDRFLLTSYERDTIRPLIWGRFEDLLLATAKSPAMLFYLDNARSFSGRLNENYARELMELHTLGVDGGYTQKDVTDLARLLTGWSMARPGEGKSGFVFRRRLHDQGVKTILGIRFASGEGLEEGERMIRILARHPSTARHIAYKLCQRLVADEPPAPLVARVAERFRSTGGDLRETVKAVIDSSEFWDPKYYRAKVKSPFEYTISAVRAVGGTIVNPLPLARELRKFGQPLYGAQPPTGYGESSEMSAGELVNRLNFVTALAEGKMPGVRVTSPIPALVLGSPEFQRQ